MSIAKKTLLLLLFIASLALIQSCGDNDKTENSNGKNKYFNPPEWIQGSWGTLIDEENPDMLLPQLKFTDDDFFILTGDHKTVYSETSYKTLLNQIAKNSGNVSVDEQISNNSYYFKINLPHSANLPIGYKLEFHLKKISDNKILWGNNPASEVQKVYLLKLGY